MAPDRVRAGVTILGPCPANPKTCDVWRKRHPDKFNAGVRRRHARRKAERAPMVMEAFTRMFLLCADCVYCKVINPSTPWGQVSPLVAIINEMYESGSIDLKRVFEDVPYRNDRMVRVIMLLAMPEGHGPATEEIGELFKVVQERSRSLQSGIVPAAPAGVADQGGKVPVLAGNLGGSLASSS